MLDTQQLYHKLLQKLCQKIQIREKTNRCQFTSTSSGGSTDFKAFTCGTPSVFLFVPNFTTPTFLTAGLNVQIIEHINSHA